MSVLFLLALLLPIAIGFLILELLIPAGSDRGIRISHLVKLFLAPGIGFALVSAVHFMWIVISNSRPSPIGLLIVEAIILIISLAIYFFSEGNKGFDFNLKQIRLPSINLVNLTAGFILIFILLIYLNTWQKVHYQNPFGNWDAWAIWNLRARFLVSGSDWLKGFSGDLIWSHPDYPLLLPLNVARLWMIRSDRSVLAPILLGLIFQLCLAGLLIVTVKTFRGRLQGILAGILGIVILFVSQNFKLYADIPIAYYFLAANVLLLFSDLSPWNQSKYLFLAGFLAGASLWTKNEGWAFLVSIVLSKLVMDLIYRKNFRLIARSWGFFLAGLAPLLLVTLLFKITYAPPGDILTGMNLNAIKDKILDQSRYLMILRFARNQFVDFGNLVIPFMPLLVLYGIIVGISYPKSQIRGILNLTLRILLLGVLYFFVYLLTPKDLNWHLNTSIERLVTHIMPSFLLLYFLVISSVNTKGTESESMFSLDWPRFRLKSR